MVVFEISINGKPHCEGEDVTTVTVVAEQLTRGRERVSIHAQSAGDENVQWLAANLGAGDEILIRLVDAAQLPDPGTHGCSFCGREIHDFELLVQGREVAICDTCILAFAAAIQTGAKLPLGASIHDESDWRCGFCAKQPDDVAGVFVRNGAAICAECLRACADLLADGRTR